jgi:hypothetical protein
MGIPRRADGPGPPVAAPVHGDATRTALTAIYNWNYEPEVDELRTLYANALERQWIAVRELDWEAGIDRDAFARSFSLAGFPVQQTRFWARLDADLRWQLSRRSAAFLLSNFLHGEQGALMVAAQLVDAVPHMDGKFFAATQTLDEARHVEVFSAYIRLLDEVQPIMPSLKTLLDATLQVDDWMHKLVGMQVVVEGLALYVFRDMRNTTEEPLLAKLLTYVSRDEARHTGYGVRYLPRAVAELGERERAELEDFAFECARMLIDSRQGTPMRQSLLALWAELGLDPREVLAELAVDRERLARERPGSAAGPVRGFVIPTLRAVGLFSPRIEGHFRQMFGANFGEQRARELDLHVPFPLDLDAWLEQRD